MCLEQHLAHSNSSIKMSVNSEGQISMAAYNMETSGSFSDEVMVKQIPTSVIHKSSK